MKRNIVTIIALIILVSTTLAVDYDILSFGAKSGGVILNTQSIQNTIDRCSADGGGRVIVPRGKFLTGTLYLKGNVILHLEQGSLLQGSSKIEDYSKHLIRAEKANNIGITGDGIIDGSGWAFWYIKPNGHYDHNPIAPGYMIYLEDCHNINIEGVRLQNADSWTLHLLGCSKATINRITIRNPLHGPNNDGIDLQASRDIIISNCDIYTSDDAIVLKNRHPKYYHLPCSNITITNCILTTVCNAFKIGTETIGSFGNIVFSNSTIRSALPTDSLAMVRLNEVKMPIRSISGISIESVDGSIVNGVAITNITMEDVRTPIFIRLANRGAGTQKGEPKAGTLKNILISNITARHAWYASSITAIPGSYIENVVLENLIFEMIGIEGTDLVEKMVDEKINEYPDAHMWKELPASGFYFRHVKGIDMKTVRVNLDNKDKRPVLIFDDAQQININSFKTDNNPIGESLIRFSGVSDARIFDLNVSPNVKYNLDIRGEDSKRIHLIDETMDKIKTTLKAKKTSISEINF